MREQNVKKYRRQAILSYFPIVGFFIAIVLNKDKNEYVNFHIRQSLGINLIMLLAILCLLTSLVLSLIVYFLFIVLWVLGLVAALQNSMKPIPLLGEKFQALFSKLI